MHGVLLAAWTRRRLAARRDGERPLLLGLNGGQGSGKSTLAALARDALVRVFDTPALVLSIDDLYLTRADRARLAEQVHPLLATRGVPGTHDVALGHRLLDALAAPADAEGVPVPRFDKAADDRAPPQASDRVREPVSVVLLEGWCVGARAVPEERLQAPVNTLEAEEDRDGRWRRYVNAQLAGPYADLFARLDALVMLRVPDFAAVRRWREAQEVELRARTGAGMTAAELDRFVAHYERVTAQQLAALPGRADLCLALDDDHAIVEVR